MSVGEHLALVGRCNGHRLWPSQTPLPASERHRAPASGGGVSPRRPRGAPWASWAALRGGQLASSAPHRRDLGHFGEISADTSPRQARRAICRDGVEGTEGRRFAPPLRGSWWSLRAPWRQKTPHRADPPVMSVGVGRRPRGALHQRPRHVGRRRARAQLLDAGEDRAARQGAPPKRPALR